MALKKNTKNKIEDLLLLAPNSPPLNALYLAFYIDSLFCLRRCRIHEYATQFVLHIYVYIFWAREEHSIYVYILHNIEEEKKDSFYLPGYHIDLLCRCTRIYICKMSKSLVSLHTSLYLFFFFFLCCWFQCFLLTGLYVNNFSHYKYLVCKDNKNKKKQKNGNREKEKENVYVVWFKAPPSSIGHLNY
jgi:hypothetical protein